MKHFRRSVLALAILVAMPAAAQITLPFHTSNSLIFVEITANGKPATMLLDSGSVRTLLSAKVMQVDLKLAAMNHKSYERGLEGTIVEMPATMIIGDHKILTDVMAGNLSQLARTMGADKCDGIIGQDVLRRFKSVRIDYKARRIEFEE
jgi:hypothetical protein